MKGFLKRRFARGEYLGLHLTIGLLLSLVILGMFLVIARGIHQEHGDLERIDLAVARAMERHALLHPLVLGLMRLVTLAGGVLALSALTVAGALTLIAYRRRLLGIVWMIAASAGALFEALLKANIGRHRPLNPDAVVQAFNPSFPSGHAMGSLVGYGMLAYLLLIRLRRPWFRATAVAFLGLLVLAIGFSRIYLRAHFLTDVLGGFCVGTVWLAVCISGLEAVRLHKKKAHEIVNRDATQPSHERTPPCTASRP